VQEAEVRHEKLLKRYEVMAAERMGLQKVHRLVATVWGWLRGVGFCCRSDRGSTATLRAVHVATVSL
jgi:hypothetical protein